MKFYIIFFVLALILIANTFAVPSYRRGGKSGRHKHSSNRRDNNESSRSDNRRHSSDRSSSSSSSSNSVEEWPCNALSPDWNNHFDAIFGMPPIINYSKKL